MGGLNETNLLRPDALQQTQCVFPIPLVMLSRQQPLDRNAGIGNDADHARNCSRAARIFASVTGRLALRRASSRSIAFARLSRPLCSSTARSISSDRKSVV